MFNDDVSSSKFRATAISSRRTQLLTAYRTDLERLNERYSLEERLEKFREEAWEAMAEVDVHDDDAGAPREELIAELADVLVVLDSLLLRPDIGPALLERLEATYKRLRERVDAGEFGPEPESQESAQSATHYEMKNRGRDGTRRFQDGEGLPRVTEACRHKRPLAEACPWCRDLHDAHTRATGEP